MIREELQKRLMRVQEICNQVKSGEVRDCFAIDLVERLLPVIRGEAS